MSNAAQPTHCYLAVQLPALRKLKMDVKEIADQSNHVQSVIRQHSGEPLRHFGNAVLAQWPYEQRKQFALAVKELQQHYPYGAIHYGPANDDLAVGDVVIALDQPGWYTTETNALFDKNNVETIDLQQSPEPGATRSVNISKAIGLN